MSFKRARLWRRNYSAWVTEKSVPVPPELTGTVGVSTRVLTVTREPADRGDIGWDVLQTIKDEVLGRDSYAVEVYPPASEIVAEEYRRHLWEVPAHLRGFFPFNLAR